MSKIELSDLEVESLLADADAAVAAELAALPFRTTPTYGDIRAALRAAFRSVLVGLGGARAPEAPVAAHAPLAPLEPDAGGDADGPGS